MIVLREPTQATVSKLEELKTQISRQRLGIDRRLPGGEGMTYRIEPGGRRADIDDARVLMRRYRCLDGRGPLLSEMPRWNRCPANMPRPLVKVVVGPTMAKAPPRASSPVRPIECASCEMKRVCGWNPDTQGSGLGRALAATAIAFARDAGYVRMKLDTLRGRMPAAISLLSNAWLCRMRALYPQP